MVEVVRIRSKAEDLVIAGDLNAHVGCLVPGNHDKLSTRGKLIHQLIETGEYSLVNALDLVENGPFTRYDIKDKDNVEKQSLLDYFIVSENLVK